MMTTIACNYCCFVKMLVCVVHEPKWSLVLGCTGAVFGWFARVFSTGFMLDDRREQLVYINKTLDMKKIEHLDPFKTASDVNV